MGLFVLQAVWCVLCAVCYVLSAVCCVLCVLCYVLCTVAVCYVLCTVAVCYVLCAVCCVLCAMCCVLWLCAMCYVLWLCAMCCGCVLCAVCCVPLLLSTSTTVNRFFPQKLKYTNFSYNRNCSKSASLFIFNLTIFAFTQYNKYLLLHITPYYFISRTAFYFITFHKDAHNTKWFILYYIPLNVMLVIKFLSVDRYKILRSQYQYPVTY